VISTILEKINGTVRNPLYVCIGGSRMCGYEDADSDWDIFVLYEDEKGLPGTFELPKYTLGDAAISLRFDSLSHSLALAAENNIKLYEKLHSPTVWYVSPQFERIKPQLLAVDMSTLLKTYHQKISSDLREFYDHQNTKAFIYAYRRCLTALELIAGNGCVIHVDTLVERYPHSHLPELATIKRSQRSKHQLAPSSQLAKEAAEDMATMCEKLTHYLTERV